MPRELVFDRPAAWLNAGYLARVVSLDDPESLNRVQVRLIAFDAIADQDAPLWARVVAPFAGQELRTGNWIETSAYKFRVNGVVRCVDPGPTENVPQDRRVRIAVKVDVFSKYDQFWVAAKDVELEKDGVVIDSEKQVKTGPECSPLLAQKRAKHDETIGGFVVFQVPDEAFVRGATVAYMPTRWGSAPRAEVKLDAKIAPDEK